MNKETDNNIVGTNEQIEEIHARLRDLERKPRQVSSPEDLESLEREIRKETEELAGLLVQKHLQASLDSEEQKKEKKN